MSQRRNYLLPSIIIALLILPAVAAATGGVYITATTDDIKEYKNLNIGTVDLLDPLDVSKTKVTLASTETGDLGELEYPLFGDIVREFDPATGTYHNVHVTATSPVTIDGHTIPCEYRFYIKPTIPSFTVNVPGKTGNVLLLKVPENLPKGATFTELFKAAAKEGYLFTSSAIIYMNETGFTVQGTIDSGNYDKDDLALTLTKNEVNLSSFITDSALARSMMDARPFARPTAGEYLIAAVQYDGGAKTMHVLAAMPVTILNENPAVTWSGDNPYYQDENKDATISSAGANKVAYALVKEGARYGLSMEVDTQELAKQPIPVSTADLVEMLKTIAGDATPVAYALTVDGVATGASGTGFAIAEGYGCSGYADASSVTIPAATLKKLNPGTYSLYAMGMNGDRVIAIDHQKDIAIKATRDGGGSSGGGGGGSSGGGNRAVTTSSETGTPQTNSEGTVLRSLKINVADNVGSLSIPIGTTALDAEGKPISEISIQPVASDMIPQVPAGALFQFAGYTYEASPDGATFNPAITLTFDIPAELWNTLDLTDRQLTVKWYNKETGFWEDVQTTISPGTRTVTATITHFSIYALFTEPVTTVTPTETATATTTATTTTPAGEAPAEGLPTTMIIFAVIIIIIIAAGVYLFVMKKD